MRFLSKLVGLVLIVLGIYFLGQNIVFTTQVAAYWWRDISATGAVVFVLSGILVLVFGRRSVKETGWLLVGIGIVLVFLSGGVILRPTSLWTFFLSFVSLIVGFRFLTTGRMEL
ncbi:hypothetical protein H6G89_02275 [Oscillatoria sp. FACHB-1407]|uniref:hypothetical protein n=1 Tax=Oscillatoria sp. FACHB-1407 TaxID=2692847 RepID=UPI0016849C61|nr:hypothetical protein [Oscillatoria sp. FACHB-1407]MBD2459860.1 hypothetical protein [Oscillatoria sp. FACHB-1407]